MLEEPIRILAVDVGAGTQDVLVYESDRVPENCFKLVLPSQTQVVARRIRSATERRRAIFLTGNLMGGGASNDAITAHLATGLPVYAAPEPARTLHNDLERVRALGVTLVDEPPPGAETIRLADIDLEAIRRLLASFEVELPSLVAIAVQDHGYEPGAGGREFRYEFLQSLLDRGGRLVDMVYREPPEYMIRMRAVRRELPGAVVMDTGAAAVLGILGDPVVASRVASGGAILVNIGNLHTFGIALRGYRIDGIFEHHTSGVTPGALAHLVGLLAKGELTHDEVVRNGGHGAAFAPDYRSAPPIEFVAVTGPNRRIAGNLGYHQAVPHGDMMLSGAFGLVEGTLRLLEREGLVNGLTVMSRQTG